MDKIDFAYLPERTSKPRTEGLTIIQDEGMSLREIEDIIAASGPLIDFVRYSPGVLFSAEELSKRTKTYLRAGITPLLSGILFEAAYIRNDIHEYIKLAEKNNIGYIEVSEGIIKIPYEEKADIIKDLSKRFIVFSKIGTKLKNVLFRNDKWKQYIKAESEAGSQKLIIEGGEAGTSIVMAGNTDIKVNLVNHILNLANIEDIIWEVPHRENQSWFIGKFGANVNLADIMPAHVPDLESQRSGINWKTLKNHLPESLTRGKLRQPDPGFNIDFQI
jgi:phosphosulfolactate synthase